jgi:hypothetical protein
MDCLRSSSQVEAQPQLGGRKLTTCGKNDSKSTRR